MIYVNGTLVDFSNRGDNYQFKKLVDEYHSTLEGLRQRHGSALVFRTTYPSRRDKVTGANRPAKPFSLTFKINVVDKDSGEQKWVYSPAAAQVKDGIAVPSEGSLIIMRGSHPISLDVDPDLVFFVLRHPLYTRGTIYIYDPKQVELDKAAHYAQSSKFIDYIYGEYSPLNDISMLHKIGRKWGISGVENMIPEAIKNSLHDKVKAADELKKKGQGSVGIAEFIADFNLGAKVDISSDVQSAMDRGYITFNRLTFEWHLNFDEDKAPWVLLKVDQDQIDNARQHLIDYLIHNSEDMDKVRQVLKGGYIKHGRVIEPSVDITPNKPSISADKALSATDEGITLRDLPNAKYASMLKFAGKVGLGKEVKGQKSDVVRSILKEFLENNAVATG